MKRIIIALMLLLGSSANFAQYDMIIKKTDSTTINIALSNISEITFVNMDSAVINYGGQNYHEVYIGEQIWLKENLNIGTMINSGTAQTSNGIIEKYCYQEDTANCTIYGGLYQWDEAMAYSTIEGSQGICPTGWHIPTDAEFTTLKNNVVSGDALKAVGQGSGTGAGTNTSGFSALLGDTTFQDIL
jgi:uncharacterized protein (TIGR02145 family)